MTDPVDALAELEVPAWLVGGALRDRLLGRATSDYDVAVAGDPKVAARQLAQRISGHPFELSEGFGAWRVVSRDHRFNVDLLPVEGSIEVDLARRDLTVNALAQPLPDGELIDPFGGLEDLRAGRLRMVSEGAFDADPLRSLRLVRLACELGFSTDRHSMDRAAAAASGLAGVAPERVFAELKRVIISRRAVQGIELSDELGIVTVILPELSALKGVGQSPYHHLDVYRHSLAVLSSAIELEGDPERFLGPHAEAADAFLSAPLANELTRWQAVRFGALLHDVAKPQTRSVTDQGRVTFIGHDALGSEMAAALLKRLRASDRLAVHVAALTRYHLRLGFLVHEAPLSRRAVYRYLRDCAPVPVDVTVLSVADRLATRGARASEAIEKHMALAQLMLGDALAWAAEPPRPPLRGDELAGALGIEPGPELGALLAELEEASFAGEITSRDEAVERARLMLAQDHWTAGE
jgi:putative nucleotidyltransferase with HDIG domain